MPKHASPAKSRTRNHRSSKSNSETSHSSSERLPPYDCYNSQDDRGAMFSHQCTRQLSASPPPVFSYPSYPHLDPYRQPNYGTSPAYSSTYSDLSSFQGEYGTPVPSIMPVAMSAGGPLKRPHTYADEEIISPFSMSYATMAGIDLCPTSHHPSESNISVRNLAADLHRRHERKERSKKADSLFIRFHLSVKCFLRIILLRRHPQRGPFSRVLSRPSRTRAPRIRFPFSE